MYSFYALISGALRMLVLNIAFMTLSSLEYHKLKGSTQKWSLSLIGAFGGSQIRPSQTKSQPKQSASPTSETRPPRRSGLAASFEQATCVTAQMVGHDSKDERHRCIRSQPAHDSGASLDTIGIGDFGAAGLERARCEAFLSSVLAAPRRVDSEAG